MTALIYESNVTIPTLVFTNKLLCYFIEYNLTLLTRMKNIRVLFTMMDIEVRLIILFIEIKFTSFTDNLAREKEAHTETCLTTLNEFNRAVNCSQTLVVVCRHHSFAQFVNLDSYVNWLQISVKPK